MITTIRDYVYIIVLLLALAATVGISYGNVLLRTVTQPWTQLEAKQR